MKTPALSVTSSVISILKIKPRIFHYLSSGSSRPQAIADTLSGITVGLIALPVALALGVASIPIYLATPFLAPAIGIFTAIIGGLISEETGETERRVPILGKIPVVGAAFRSRANLRARTELVIFLTPRLVR